MATRKTHPVMLASLALAAVGLGASLSHSAAQARTVHEVPEDSPLWNCYTMGNGSCGDMVTVPGEDGTRGAVLPGGFGFGPTVAWSNGPVWSSAPASWRWLSWQRCVKGAEGTDASLAECDEDWQVTGERFDMAHPA